jgi:hypothetical protein
VEWFEEVLQRRALAGVDEHLGRHAGDELQVVEAAHLGFGQRHPH